MIRTITYLQRQFCRFKSSPSNRIIIGEKKKKNGCVPNFATMNFVIEGQEKE